MTAPKKLHHFMHGVRFSKVVHAFGSTFGVRSMEWRSVRSTERVYAQFDTISSGTGKICLQHGGVRLGEVSAKGGSTAPIGLFIRSIQN